MPSQGRAVIGTVLWLAVGGLSLLPDWQALDAVGEAHDLLLKAAIGIVVTFVGWVTLTLRRGEKVQGRMLILLEGQKDKHGEVIQVGVLDRISNIEDAFKLVRNDAMNEVTAPLVDIQLRMDRVDEQVTAIGERVDNVYTTFGRKT